MPNFQRTVVHVIPLAVLWLSSLLQQVAIAQAPPPAPANGTELDGLREYQATVMKLNDMGLSSDARALGEKVLESRKRLTGSASTEVADSMSDLGLICRDQGDYAAALKYLEQALAIDQKAHGTEHQATALVLSRLSVLQELQGDISKARQTIEQAFKIQKKVLGEKHPDTLSSMIYLGELMQFQGEMAAAKPIVERALQLCRSELGEEHRETAKAHSTLGIHYYARGEYSQARPYLERTLAIRKKVLGVQHPDTALSLRHWGMVLMSENKNDEARPLLEQAYEITRRMRGEDHPNTAFALNAIGEHELALRNYDSAIEYASRALDILKEKLGEQHHDLAGVLYSLALAHMQKGNTDTALTLAQQSLAIMNKTFGPAHRETANVTFLFGNVLYSKGDYAAAKIQFTQAYNILVKQFGESNDYAALGHFYLGMTAHAQKDLPTARQHYESALAIYTKNNGEENGSAIDSRRELSSVLLDMKEYGLAKSQLERVVALCKKVFGNESEQAAQATYLLAICHHDQSNFAEARKYYDEALTIQTKLFGEESETTAQTQYALGLMLKTQQDIPGARVYLEKSLATRQKQLGALHRDTKQTLIALASLGTPPPKAATLPPRPGTLPPNPAVAPPTPTSPQSIPNPASSSYATSSADLITPQDIASLSQAQIERLLALMPRLQQLSELVQRGQYRQFLSPAEKLSQDIIDLVGPGHKLTALAIGLRGSVHREMGDYEQAQKLLENALALQIQLVGEQGTNTDLLLVELSNLHMARGNISEANEYANRSLKIRRALYGENHSTIAMANYQLGVIALSAQDYELGKTHLEKATTILDTVQRAGGGDAKDLELNRSAVLSNMALLQHLSGDVLRARENYEKVLAIRRRVLGDLHPDTAFSLLEVGLMQYSLGDLPLSQKTIEQALKIYEKALGENHPKVAVVLSTLGDVCIARKNFAEARTHFERARAIRLQSFGEKHQEYAATLVSLGTLEREVGNFKAAKTFFDQAFSLYQAKFGRDSFVIANVLSQVTELLLLQGKYADARVSAEEYVRLLERPITKNSFDMAQALRKLSEAQAGANDWSAATHQMDSARRLVRRLASDVLPGLSERELLQCLKTADEDFWHTALSMGLARRTDQSTIDLTASWLVNGKGIAQESLAKQQAVRLAKREGIAIAESPVTGKWIELDTIRQAVPADTIVFDFARIRIRNFASTTRDAQWGAAHYVAWIIPPAGAGQVRVIDLGEAEGIDALVTEFNGVMKASMNTGKSTGTIKELGDVEATKLIDKTLQALAGRILEPLRGDMAKFKKVAVSPDASLWLIPWAALPIGEDKYLIEETPLQLIVSSRDLVPSKRDSVPLNPPVIMADPGFDLTSQEIQVATKAVLRAGYQPLPSNSLRSASLTDELPKVQRLPYTAIEAKTIQPDVESIAKTKPLVYTGEYALEGVFKKVNQPKMMVLSTHGVFLPPKQSKATVVPVTTVGQKQESALLGPTENPLLRCGLLLAGCNQRPVSTTDDDGILTGDEIMGCNLRGTELVVLSACETGVGEVRNGDGVAGLRQAFQLAGAKSVVATLWVIDDRESAFFMRDFFKALGEKQSPEDAMRSAQLARIESRRNHYGAAHPFYWAAWTLTGGIE